MSIGLCVTDDCSLDDLRAIAKAATGNHVQVKVHDCVTSKYRVLTKTETAILIAFGIIGILIVSSTALDLYFYFSGAAKQSSKDIIKVGMAFSLLNSTQTFLATSSNKQSEAYKYRFLHGMRVASILWIVFGHCIVPYGNSGARATKMLVMGDEIASCIITAGFLAVDTFFFMSGFLLAYNIQRQKANRFLITIIAIVRRYIRLNEEMDNHWLELLLQVRNFGKKLQNTSSTAHLWYVSADFQLFVIALLVCVCFKGRNPWITIIVFMMLSLLCCGALCWQMHSTVYYPFVVVLGDSFEAVHGTLNDVYVTPWYHAASYFAGCITLLLQQKYGGAKISKALVGIVWVFAAACCLACVLMRYDWNRGREHAQTSIRMACVFWDRILFSFTLSWIAFACSTGRGGFFQKFLAWKRFVPLSRLTFGVYLIHLPFLHFVYNSTRERVYYSKFNVVTLYFGTIMWCGILSFFLFAAFEVPTATLDRLLFERRARGRPAKILEDITASSKKAIFENPSTKSVILLDLKQKNGIF
ncbi:nose resistant to fluoxetine protein 6 [Ixodes scapularis]